MPSKAAIAATVARSFDRAGDVIVAATLRRETASYGAGTTSAVTTTPEDSACRLLFDQGEKTVSQYLSGVDIKPTDKVIWLQGPSFVPKAGDELIRSGQPKLRIVHADDLLQAGALHLVVGR